MRYSTHLLRHFRATIGRNIRSRRTFRQVTIEQLSSLSGLPAIMIDRYELGKYEIGTEELLKIACALKVEPMELMKEG